MNYQEFGHAWFISHLSDRSQYVVIIATGLLLPVLCGVPQGSHVIPGPLLLLNYTIYKLAIQQQKSPSVILSTIGALIQL